MGVVTKYGFAVLLWNRRGVAGCHLQEGHIQLMARSEGRRKLESLRAVGRSSIEPVVEISRSLEQIMKPGPQKIATSDKAGCEKQR